MIYLFVDGLAERLHLGQPREAMLAAWGVLADGHKVLLHLAPGSKEDTASCREFFQDMRRRGLPDPLLVISDGAPGLFRTIEDDLPSDASPPTRPRRGLLCRSWAESAVAAEIRAGLVASPPTAARPPPCGIG